MKKRLLSKIAIAILTVTSIITTHGSDIKAKVKNNRIYGQDRLETSVKISKSGWKNGSHVVVIAQGYDYADALCCAPLAKKYNAPILLTKTAKLSDNTLNEIERLKAKKVFIIGGPKVVSEEVNKQLKSVNINEIQRVYGATRYETSLEIAKCMGDTKEVFLTSGNGYGDSLSIASIAAKKGAPILFSDKKTVKDSIKQYIDNKKAYVIGGNGVIAEDVVKSLKGSERVWGKDRFETNKNVLEKFKKDISFENLYLVLAAGPNRNEFADALSCSALAGHKASPIILTYKDIKPSLESFIKNNLLSISSVTAIGGEANVPSKILDKLNVKFDFINISNDNTVYGEEKNTKTINGDLAVNSNKVTLQNLNVLGVLTVNPGEKGSVDIKNVTANTVIVKSGDVDSIHFYNSKIRNLIIDSSSNVRVKLLENSIIDNTNVLSASLLENTKGSFGNVLVEDMNSKKPNNKVDFIGAFEKPIDIIGKTEARFKGTFSEIKIGNQSKIDICKESKVEKISANAKCDIKVFQGAEVKKVEKGIEDVSIYGKVLDVVNSNTSNSSGSSNNNLKPNSDEVCILVLKDNGSSTLISKNLKIEKDKNALDYLKSVAKISESDGFIDSIEGLSSVTNSSLTLEERKKGVLGIDWFIYINGKKSSKGVKEIYPTGGDSIKFVYEKWDWKSLVDESDRDKMPIKIQSVPSDIKAGEKFKIRATCINRGVYNAVVKVNGEKVATTDIDGYATIEINSSGKHSISVEKDGGTEKVTVNVKSSGSGGSGSGGSSSEGGDGEDSFKELKKFDGYIILKVLKNKDNKIKLELTSNINEEVTITLFDKNNSLCYIGQGILKDGKYIFNTVLDKGKYYGVYRGKNGEKIEVQFEIA
ncbi:cell wall-binding repeat-containing protein [Clostridium rectalis]|uniref:cell wall-binding repeat-containing protein n=1 Tax=Clostridium rectalis TaxID=2040295 RepID=UPI000F639C58|nr:cell wall-binding repeat-containing protein [Clostridium rectalis]